MCGEVLQMTPLLMDGSIDKEFIHGDRLLVGVPGTTPPASLVRGEDISFTGVFGVTGLLISVNGLVLELGVK
jgi:hypothetical protein